MFAALAGLAGLAAFLFAYDAVGKSEGFRAACFGAVALVLFGVTILGSPLRPDRGGTDCYTDWDMRVSRTVCD
jgi:hypothetical protein